VVTLPLLAFTACGDDEPPSCEELCLAGERYYPQLVADFDVLDPDVVPGFGSDGDFDKQAYEEACESAPDTESCRECGDWYNARFLLGEVQNSCDTYYHWDEWGVYHDSGEYGQYATACAYLCGSVGLQF